MQKTTLKIDGMTCMGCVNSVKNVLKNISGVQEVEISLEQGLATIQYDPASTDIDQFRKTIMDAGFEVTN